MAQPADLVDTNDPAISIALEAVDELIQRHQLEIQLDLSQKFYSLVAHDLRTPLTTAKLNAGIIVLRPKDPESCVARAQQIIDSLNRAERMIHDLLDANSYRAGKGITVRPELADLRKIASETIRSMAEIHRGCCSLEVSAATGERSVLGMFDPIAIRRVLENLITNAVKYGFAGAPITVRITSDHERALIQVRNQGTPLSESERSELFHWHNRTAKARKSTESSGWGMGLMLVKGIAEAHGGTVRVESSATTGTVFILDISRGNWRSAQS
jgi:signal transduction histidine kinase